MFHPTPQSLGQCKTRQELEQFLESHKQIRKGFNIIFMENDQLIKAKIKSTVLRFKNQEKGITSYNARIDGESKDQRQLNL